MAYDGESLIATAIERLNENMMRMDERQQKYQEKTDMKLDKMGEVLGKLVFIDTELKESSKRIHHRIDEVEKMVVKVEDTMSIGGCGVFKEYIAHMDGLDIEGRIKTLEDIPKKRIETMKLEAIKWFTIIVLGLIGLKLGLTK